MTSRVPDPVDLAAWTSVVGDAPGAVDATALYPGGDLRVLIVNGRGPRHDWHINPVAELFQQIRGDIVVRVRDGDDVRDVPVRVGQLWLAPADVPHSPQRPIGSVGLVVERLREPDQTETFRWTCERCGATVYEVVRSATAPVDLARATAAFEADLALRTCGACGEVVALA